MVDRMVYWLVGGRNQKTSNRQYAFKTFPAISFDTFSSRIKEVTGSKSIYDFTYSRGGRFENVVINNDESLDIAIRSSGEAANNPEKGIAVLISHS